MATRDVTDVSGPLIRDTLHLWQPHSCIDCDHERLRADLGLR